MSSDDNFQLMGQQLTTLFRQAIHAAKEKPLLDALIAEDKALEPQALAITAVDRVCAAAPLDQIRESGADKIVRLVVADDVRHVPTPLTHGAVGWNI